MATVVDLLRKLGKRASGEANAFVGPVVLSGAPAGAVAADAASLAQSSPRSSVALVGQGAQVQSFLAGTVMSRLRAQPDTTALWIAAERADPTTAGMRAAARDAGVRVLEAQGEGRVVPARLIIATPLELHRHLLRVHDRAWSWLWPHLDLVVLPDAHKYAGPPAAHLRWLLRRANRLRSAAGAAEAPALVASIAPVSDVDAAFDTLTDQGRLIHGRLRVIRVDDRPAHNTLLSLWRSGPDRGAELERLVEALAAHKLQADVLDGPKGTRRARPSGAPTPHVAIAPQVPRSAAERTALLRRGYRMLVLLAGDEPHEQFFAAHPELLADEEVAFPDAEDNSYIAAPQLCCAGAELPIVEAELDRWSAVELRDRLARAGAIVSLPGEDMWHTNADPPDPYEELDPRSVCGKPYTVSWADGRRHSYVSAMLAERSAREGAVVAPGLRVQAVDDDARTITVVADATAAATVVAAGSEVAVRDELAARTIKRMGADLTRGRVMITQRILALRDLLSDGTQRRVSIQPPHEMQWSAAACWIKLPFAEGTRLEDPATAGWSLAYALPLVMLAGPEALTTAYDEERRVLFLVETEPGGTGVASAVYELFEQLVDRARMLIEACARRPAWERLAAGETLLLGALAGASASARNRASARVYVSLEAAPAQTAAVEQPAEQPDAAPIVRFPRREAAPEPPEDRAAVALAPAAQPALFTVEPPAQAPPGPAADPPADTAPDATGAHTEPEAAAEQATPEAAAEQPVPAEQAASDEPAIPARRARRAAVFEATAAPPAGERERKPDVKALIERMRRLREEREAQQRAGIARAADHFTEDPPDGVEPRFHIGARVQCLPYGTGIVRSSRRADERELLVIEFPDYGEIEVDSSISLVRAVDDIAQHEAGD